MLIRPPKQPLSGGLGKISLLRYEFYGLIREMWQSPPEGGCFEGLINIILVVLYTHFDFRMGEKGCLLNNLFKEGNAISVAP